jgi:hypothetical protein
MGTGSLKDKHLQVNDGGTGDGVCLLIDECVVNLKPMEMSWSEFPGRKCRFATHIPLNSRGRVGVGTGVEGWACEHCR